MKQLFFCLLVLLFISNCTLEKRRYRNGFYVDRHHDLSAATLSPEEKPETAASDVKQKSFSEKEATVSSQDTAPVVTKAATPSSFRKKAKEILQQKGETLLPTPKQIMSSADDAPITNRLSTLAFGCAILAVAAALTLLLGWGFAFFALAFAPMALIFGLIARNQIKREPERYKNKYYATIGIIVGGLTFLVAIVFVAAVFIALANFQ